MGGTLVILPEREERLVGYCRTREGPWLFFPQREEGGKDIDGVPQDKEKTEVFAVPWEGECRAKVSWVLRDEEVTHVVAM